MTFDPFWLSINFINFLIGDQTNPFLQEQYAYDAAGAQIPVQQQAYYGGGYTQAQSGYSSSGYGKLFFAIFSISKSLFTLWYYHVSMISYFNDIIISGLQ